MIPTGTTLRFKATIHIGGVWASRDPSIVETVLGSCISVCLRDPVTGIGGMNHFILPDSLGEDLSARYGVHAMELLINRCMQEGADRRRLEAKVFGGGHVLKTLEHGNSIPRKNILFALSFLQTECIPVVSQDVGGYAARKVAFYTDTGQVFLKRLTETGFDAVEFVERERREYQSFVAMQSRDDGITIF